MYVEQSWGWEKGELGSGGTKSNPLTLFIQYISSTFCFVFVFVLCILYSVFVFCIPYYNDEDQIDVCGAKLRNMRWGQVAPTLTFNIFPLKLPWICVQIPFVFLHSRKIIFLCFNNMCQRVELADMLCHMCHRTKAFVCVLKGLMRTHAHTHTPSLTPLVMFRFELALPIVSNAHTVFGPFPNTLSLLDLDVPFVIYNSGTND